MALAVERIARAMDRLETIGGNVEKYLTELLCDYTVEIHYNPITGEYRVIGTSRTESYAFETHASTLLGVLARAHAGQVDVQS